MSPIASLFLCLLGVAAAGIVIGWFSRRISAIKEHNSTVAEAEARIDSLTMKLRNSVSDASRVSEKLQQARATISAYEKASRQSDQTTGNVTGELKPRDQNIADLEAQLKAVEGEQQQIPREDTRLRQPEFGKKRVVDQATSNDSRQSVVAEEDLPVLKKKPQSVTKGANKAIPVTGELPDITDELDDFNEDVLEMTSEFDFDPAELLAEDSEFDELTDKLLSKDGHRS